MSSTISAVLFDLDGTLLDTLDDLADSMNAVLHRLGLAGHPREAYRYFVGEGMEVLARRSLPQSLVTDTLVSECVELMRQHYGANWANKTKPYEGISEMLRRLGEEGMLLAVLSNKPHAMTVKVVNHFFPHQDFAAVWGARPEVSRKPSPDGALALAAELGISPGRVLYLGDTSIDMRTAKGAGMLAIGATWGFRTEEELVESGADAVVTHPLEVLGFLKG